MENGDFGGTLDASTSLSSLRAFFAAFFAFFAPPMAVMAAWTLRRLYEAFADDIAGHWGRSAT